MLFIISGGYAEVQILKTSETVPPFWSFWKIWYAAVKILKKK